MLCLHYRWPCPLLMVSLLVHLFHCSIHTTERVTTHFQESSVAPDFLVTALSKKVAQILTSVDWFAGFTPTQYLDVPFKLYLQSLVRSYHAHPLWLVHPTWGWFIVSKYQSHSCVCNENQTSMLQREILRDVMGLAVGMVEGKEEVGKVGGAG